MTETEIKTELDNLDTEEAALRSAVGFSSTAAGGGSVSVSDPTNKLKYIGKRRLFLMRRLHAIGGAKPAEPKAVGIDIDMNTDNDDGVYSG
jgi:hypothetical protein